VRRGGVELALRLAPPEDDGAAAVAALRFWAGRGTVQLVDADETAGAMLLERLDGTRSLMGRPVIEAATILGAMMRRLAVPAPDSVRSTADIAAERLRSLAGDWQRLGRPFPSLTLDRALEGAAQLALTTSDLAVNGDLHHDQVLAGRRAEWLCVDPLLLRGDIDYDLARSLWYRLDELTDDRAIDTCFHTMVGAAGLDPDRARTWVVFRSLDYWLWGLDHGLTEDPVRCGRLVDHFGG
jgi:streptomycin 6-kinase